MSKLPFLLLLLMIPVVQGLTKTETAQNSYIPTSWKDESKEYYTKLVNFAFATGKNDSFFLKTSDGKFQIKDIRKSIEFEGMEYSFQVERFEKETFNCRYQFGKQDVNFQKVIFENGKKANSLYFVCTYMRSCSGLECKWNWNIPIFVALMLSAGAAVLLAVALRLLLPKLLHRIFPFCY